MRESKKKMFTIFSLYCLVFGTIGATATTVFANTKTTEEGGTDFKGSFSQAPYLDTSEEIPSSFHFDQSTMTGVVGETIRILLFSNQEIDEIWIQLSKEVKIVQEELPTDLKVTKGVQEGEWFIQSASTRFMFDIPVSSAIAGSYEVLVERDSGATLNIEIIPEEVEDAQSKEAFNNEKAQLNEYFINGDFEEPVFNGLTEFFNQADVPGWNTTAQDGLIEFGRGRAHNIFGAASGNQFAELNATMPGELYQLVAYEPGSVLRWRLSHAGRFGVDTMRLRIGRPESPETIQEMRSPSGLWTEYNGTYIVPEDQPITYFGFEALSTSNGSLDMGNLIDAIHFATQSSLNVVNQVDKKQAQAGDKLSYLITIENTGGVPADRVEIEISGLDNTLVDTTSFKIGSENIEPSQVSFENGIVKLALNTILLSDEMYSLTFNTIVKQDYLEGEINTNVVVDYWDETFDDISYQSYSNEVTTIINTSSVAPVDPLEPEIDVDPENKPELPENQGQLSIDFISSFNFGSQTISVHDQTYYAQPQRLLNEDGTVNDSEERPNYVQISDRRSENERNGWTLAVSQKEQFKGSENQGLNGASLSLSNQQVITAQGGTAPGLQSVPCTLVPGNRRTLLHAQGSEGTGTWIYRFGDGETAGESVALDVPRGANPEATTYSSTLIWELSAVPGN